MSFKTELERLFDYCGLTDTGRRTVERIRQSDPVRLVSGNTGNITSLLPSPKTGQTVPAESRHGEVVQLLVWHWDAHVNEVFGQPISIRYPFRDRNGKPAGGWHVPDYLKIADDHIVLAEITTPTEAEKRARKWPDRMCKDDEGNWRSPAGEAGAAEVGLDYEVYVPGKPDIQCARNVRYLWEYMFSDPTDEQKESIDELTKRVERDKSVIVTELNAEYGPEVTKYAIAHRYVFFRIFEDNLPASPDATVYAEPEFASIAELSSQTRSSERPPEIRLAQGSRINWDGVVYELANDGEMYTFFDPSRTRAPQRLAPKHCQDLIQCGAIKPIDGAATESDCLDQLRRHGDDDQIKAASDLCKRLFAYWRKETWPLDYHTDRWYRELGRRYHEAQLRYDDGLIGLIDNKKNRGNYTVRFKDHEREVFEESLWTDYARENAPTVKAAYDQYVLKAQSQGVAPKSYETYRNWARKIHNGEVTAMRHGEAARYQQGPGAADKTLYEARLPVHGDRAFELAHIDHTGLPVELRSAYNGKEIGTVWLTVMEDAYTRIVLAHLIHKVDPSVAILIVVMRECVRRYGRLPRRIMVDRGKPFDGEDFHRLLARYQIEKDQRGPKRPREGSLVESFFNKTESQIIRQLTGSTTNRDQGRALSKSHRPERHALWTPDELDHLLEDYFYHVYPYERHSGLHDEPARVFQASLRETGQANNVAINCDNAFFVYTLPYVRNRQRKINKGKIQVDNLEYRPAETSATQLNGQKVTVKHDPMDVTHVFAYMYGDWYELVSTNHYLLKAYEMNIRHLGLEVQANASETNRQYRKPSTNWIHFIKRNNDREARLRDGNSAEDAGGAADRDAENGRQGNPPRGSEQRSNSTSNKSMRTHSKTRRR